MVQTTIRMPKKLYEKLKFAAKERGVSVNSFIITILFDYPFNVEQKKGEI